MCSQHALMGSNMTRLQNLRKLQNDSLDGRKRKGFEDEVSYSIQRIHLSFALCAANEGTTRELAQVVSYMELYWLVVAQEHKLYVIPPTCIDIRKGQATVAKEWNAGRRLWYCVVGVM